MYANMYYIVVYNYRSGDIHRMEELDDMAEVVAIATLAAMSGLETLSIDEKTFNRVYNGGPDNYRVEMARLVYRHAFALA